MTGASVTNKGIYYEPGKEPPAEGPPKLHLLIESSEEWRVRNIHVYLSEQDLSLSAGGTSRARDQAPPHRGFRRCSPSRNAQPDCDCRTLQRRLNIVRDTLLSWSVLLIILCTNTGHYAVSLSHPNSTHAQRIQSCRHTDSDRAMPYHPCALRDAT